MNNLPILYRNVMDGLPSDLARDAFLWATERPGGDRHCYQAEAFAREVDRLVRALAPMLAAATRIHAAQGLATTDPHDPDLLRFILTRHANLHFGGNCTPPYASL